MICLPKSHFLVMGWLLLGGAGHSWAAELLVLMHGSGKVERYATDTGKHLGTCLSGLPASNALLFTPDGRLLISTGLPGEVGSVLRYDPKARKMESWINIPEGYGGHLLRATGMAWHAGDLLVASQGDGKIKRFDGNTGEWKSDCVSSTAGGTTQIAVHEGRLYLTDHGAKSLRQASQPWEGAEAPVWASHAGQAPWGLVIDSMGRAYWSTNANRILRTEGKATVEWAGAGGGLATPIGLALAPDGLLYTANLQGKVSVWKTDQPQAGAPARVLGGDEMKSPISIAFSTVPVAEEFRFAQAAKALAETPDKLAFFESAVRPLLLTRCVECHGAKKQKGGLRLDSRQFWEKGGELGLAILPGKPDESLLIKAIRYHDKDLQMPPKKPLTPQEIDILVEWVGQGAIAPLTDTVAATAPDNSGWETTYQKRLAWWSLMPPRNLEPPKPFPGPWGQDGIDRFILARLQEAGLKPAPRAEPEVLLRRLAFVLTGLPPSIALRDKFLASTRQDSGKAYRNLVDELLASPHFGERFARHWMDVVRYTDTYGYEWDNPAKGSHEYRDYLIRAFNDDLPYDQFVREQLAGDLLANPRVNTALAINESLIAPMFYHMGEHRHGSSLAFNGVHQEMVNNKIDAFSKAFLATTVACSRCHDHKLEAISQRDYYALGAVFMTPRWTCRVVDAPGKNDAAIKKLQTLRDAIRAEMAGTWRKASANPATWAADSWRKSLPPKDAKTPPIEDIGYPLMRLLGTEDGLASRWNALASEWRATRAERLKHNQSFTAFADFTKPALPPGWVTEGDGMRFGHVADGTPLVSLEGDAIFARLLPRGIHTHALSSRLPGALRMPPDHRVAGQRVSLNLAGGQFGGYLEVHENAFQGEEVTFLTNPQPQWRTFTDKALINGITRITYEFATAALNPNFPPRTGLAAGLPNNDPGYDKRSWISITGIVTHEGATTPLDTLDAFAGLYEGPEPKNIAEANRKIANWFAAAVTRWCDTKSRPGDQALLDWLLARQLLANTAPVGSPMAGMLAEYRSIERGIPFARTVNSMDERETSKASFALNIRGNVDAIGSMVSPDFLRMFEGRNSVAKSAGSGRLELADSLTRVGHPLTARVYVNRLWQWVMGSGLVATPDDFGRLGEKPTHPELLDYLANEIVREGWSTKKLIRRMVLAETFGQAGLVSDAGRDRDPDNRLRHHYPTRRLEAEAIRDSMLAISGRLDPQLYGRPVFPPRVAEDGAKRLFAGPLDGNGRRSLYQQMSIMEPPKFLVGFNLPDLRLPTGKRDTTNVPAQALIILNDPFVSAMAQYWAGQLVKVPHATPQERVRALFAATFAREPSLQELGRWTAAALEFHGPGQPDILLDQTAWAQLCHAFFNTKEFLYYR